MENKTKVIIGVSAAAILIGAVVGILVFNPKKDEVSKPSDKKLTPTPNPASKNAYAKAGQDIYDDMYNTDVSFSSGEEMPLKVIGCDEITGVCKVEYSHWIAGDNVTGYISKYDIIYK